ncbi:MAG: hypothetical protein FIA94_15150, partial [Nitrospirae bacterium]|nr:hypothetical protein [Nitrospirota bacterium]
MHVLSRIKSRITSPRVRRAYHGVLARYRPLKKGVLDVYRQDHPGIYINWNIFPRRWSNTAKIHWCVTRAVWRERKCYAVLSFLAWPVKAAILAGKMTRQHGLQVKRRTGLGLGGQYIEQIRLAFRHGIAPRAYYFYGLYRQENRKRAPLFIQDHEIGALLRLLNTTADYTLFDDKRRFFAECERHGLPTIPIIADFEQGSPKYVRRDSDGHLPQTDLFAKPALGKCGTGVKVFTYERPGLYRSEDGRQRTGEDLLNDLAEYSRTTPYILQERYVNHPEISNVAPSALCTSRVVTCRLPDGTCEDIIAIFKMPSGDCCTDNFSTGGIAISVDRSSGLLGSAISKSLDAERIDAHPASGCRISGFRIPHWNQVIQLCVKAHAAFSGYAYVGWDVAVTGDGPVLVEGNLNWGVESMQRAHYGPLGETRFAESLLLHIDHRKCFRSMF